MTTVVPTNFAASGSDAEALFLKMYTGSFVSAPRSGIFLAGGVADRYIYRPSVAGGGKSWQFLMAGDVPEPEEFLPGEDVLGQVMAIEEGTIVTDNYIVCHKWIGKDKMDQAHFASQIPPTIAAGHKSRIERFYDKRAMITAALGARQTTAVTKNGLNIHQGSSRVTRSAGGTGILSDAYPLSATGAANLRADLRAHGLQLDQKNIAGGPQNRAIALDPYLRSVLTYDATGQVFSRDYVTTNDQMRHEIEVLERFAILGYPNTTSNGGPLPNELITTGPTKYQGNFTSATSNGIPGVLSFNRTNDGEYGLGAVEFEKTTHIVRYFDYKLAWLFMTYMRAGVDLMHPWALGSIEAID